MKKKIFLMLAIVAMLICTLAISVSAQEIKKFETDEFQSGDNITYLEGISEDMYLADDSRNNSFYELLDPNFTARAVLKNSDGTYTTYPAWYFISFTHYWNGASCAYTVNRINALSDVTGETYSTSSIIRYEFPEYKTNHTFSLQKSVSFALAKVKYVRVPSHATSISFQDASALVEIEYAPGANITSVNSKAFKDCHSLEIIRIPNTTTSIGNQAVVFWSTTASTAALKEIYLGASMKTLGTNQAISTANVDGLKIYVPATLDGATYTFAKYFPAKSMLIFTGTKEQAEAFGASKVVSYEEYAATDFAHEVGTIVYGYSVCDAFYDGKHVEKNQDNNPCILADCENCNVKNLYVGNESTHSEATTIVYESYDKAGSKIVYCTNEGCTHSVTTEASALFTCLGYSASENGTGGIVIGFAANDEAITEYEEITGKTIKYGVFAVLQDRLGNNDVFSKDGTTAEGVVNADITNYEFAVFELKIVGFTDNQKDAKIAMGAYVAVTDGETTEYSYMQGRTPAEGDNYYYVSYNDVVTPAASDKEATR